jgi:hypothetical protein
MMRTDPKIKPEEKKRLVWDIQKALEDVPTIGGGTTTVCQSLPMLANSY